MSTQAEREEDTVHDGGSVSVNPPSNDDEDSLVQVTVPAPVIGTDCTLDKSEERLGDGVADGNTCEGAEETKGFEDGGDGGDDGAEKPKGLEEGAVDAVFNAVFTPSFMKAIRRLVEKYAVCRYTTDRTITRVTVLDVKPFVYPTLFIVRGDMTEVVRVSVCNPALVEEAVKTTVMFVSYSGCHDLPEEYMTFLKQLSPQEQASSSDRLEEYMTFLKQLSPQEQASSSHQLDPSHQLDQPHQLDPSHQLDLTKPPNYPVVII
jgi:hypothetical protein